MSSNFTLSDFPQSGMPSVPDRHHNLNSKVIYGSLASLFMIALCILCLHLYSKWIYQRSNRRYASWRRRHGFDLQVQDPLKTGLNKAVVNSLPTFVYKVIQSQTDALECAVCLSEFQEAEKGRLLPKCSHRFHMDCIDTWFLSNTTCPLCRMSAEPTDCGSTVDGQDGSSSMFLADAREALSQSDSRGEPANAVAESLQNRVGSLLRRQLLLQAPEARSWRRSISDRFPQISQGVQFPTNVLFWGNHAHVNSRVNWEEGGRSLPHIVVEVPRSQDNILTLRTASMNPSLCSSFEDPSCSSPSVQQHPFNRLSTLKRLLSREKKFTLSDQDLSGCGAQG